MKIAFSIAHMGIGGAQRVTLNLIQWINRYTTHDTLLFIGTTRKVSDFEYPLNNIKYYKLPDSKVSKVKKLRSLLQEEQPDVLITMGLPDTIIDTTACIGLPIKHVISERNDPRNFKGKFITKLLSRICACFADGYVFQTLEAMKYYKLPCFRKGIVIPNPLIGLDQMPNMPFDGQRRKEIVTVGRLNAQKNHPLLITTFANIVKEFPDYKLVIYGEGSTENSLREMIQELGLQDYISLPGSVSDVFERIYEARAFVLSSNFEGMPNALMEALALGVPCVSTDCPCGGPKELIENGKSGLLVQVNNKSELINAIKSIMTDDELSNTLSKNAFKIRGKLNPDKISNDWLNYIKTVVQQ